MKVGVMKQVSLLWNKLFIILTPLSREIDFEIATTPYTMQINNRNISLHRKIQKETLQNRLFDYYILPLLKKLTALKTLI